MRVDESEDDDSFYNSDNETDGDNGCIIEQEQVKKPRKCRAREYLIVLQ